MLFTVIVHVLEGPTWHPPIDQTSLFLLLYPFTVIFRMLTFNKLGLSGGSVVKCTTWTENFVTHLGLKWP